MTNLRFGLVGCGRIGSTADERVAGWAVADRWLPYTHAGAIVATPGARLAAVCDSDPASAERAMIKHGAAASYTSYEEMLACGQLDVVSIATRTAERGAIIHAGLKHGIRAIYCEKPLANSLEDSDELAEAVTRAGIPFIYGVKRRFMPVYERVRSRIIGGELGEVTTIVVRFGYGSLLWSLPHAVDIASFFAGDVSAEQVQADLSLDPDSVGEDNIDCDPVLNTASIRFSNGVRAVLVSGEGMDVEIAGRDGLVSIQADGARVEWRRRLSNGSDIGWLLDRQLDAQDPPSSGTQRGFAALVHAVKDGADPGYGIQDAVSNQEILFAMTESQLRGGISVHLPLERRGLIITGRTGTLHP